MRFIWVFYGHVELGIRFLHEIPGRVKVRAAMPDASIHTHGRILERTGPVLYRVSLPNGKIILAHLSKPLADAHASYGVDRHVLLELTPYDFDAARILGDADA